MVIQHLKQIGKVKNLDKWVPHELTTNLKKKSSFWSVVFSYPMQWQWTVSPSDYDVRWNWILYDSRQQPAQWLDREASRHFPKQNLHPKKVMVILWWSAPDLINYNFLNSSETIISEKYAQQIDEMLEKLQRLQLALVDRRGPILLPTTLNCTLHN